MLWGTDVITEVSGRISNYPSKPPSSALLAKQREIQAGQVYQLVATIPVIPKGLLCTNYIMEDGAWVPLD